MCCSYFYKFVLQFNKCCCFSRKSNQYYSLRYPTLFVFLPSGGNYLHWLLFHCCWCCCSWRSTTFTISGDQKGARRSLLASLSFWAVDSEKKIEREMQGNFIPLFYFHWLRLALNSTIQLGHIFPSVLPSHGQQAARVSWPRKRKWNYCWPSWH